MLDLILGSIQVVAAVRAEMEARAAAERHNELLQEISHISRVLASVRQCTNDPSTADMKRASRLHQSLVRAVEESPHFASRIKVVPVRPGVVRLSFRRTAVARPTVLRDPSGEYGEWKLGAP